MKNIGEGEYSVIGEYLGRKKEIRLKHKCGYIYTNKRAEFLIDGDGGKCPMCSLRSKNTKETLLNRLKNAGADLTLLEPFETNKTKYRVKNNKCGHEYIIRTYDVLSRGKSHCMVCENKSPKNIDINRVITEFKNLDINYLVLDTEYKGTHTPILVKHLKRGHEYKVSRTNFLMGKRCPKCSVGKGYSYKEEDLLNFIKTLTNIRPHYRVLNEKTGGFPEIDILSENNIGIEFDGLFWHSTGRKLEYSLLEKTEFFKSHNIPVLHIFEDEWDNQQDIIKNRLSDILLNNTQYIQDPNNPDQLIPFTNEIQSNRIVIDRRWFITDKDILAAGYRLTETLPPKEFFLTNSYDIRHTKKSDDTKFSIFDCGYFVYEK